MAHDGRIDTSFEIGEWVNIDNDDSLRAIVTCIEVRPGPVVRYEVSWMHSGDVKFCMLDQLRLSTAKSR